jgi:hypothetical protein
MSAPLRKGGRKVKRYYSAPPFNALLTITTPILPPWPGANRMKQDHDRFLMIRAELYDLCDALRLTDFDANPVQYLLRLEQIRATAALHGLTAIAEIASTFEAALQRVKPCKGGHAMIEGFGEILRDAIGVADLHPKASEALLASVAIRFG